MPELKKYFSVSFMHAVAVVVRNLIGSSLNMQQSPKRIIFISGAMLFHLVAGWWPPAARDSFAISQSSTHLRTTPKQDRARRANRQARNAAKKRPSWAGQPRKDGTPPGLGLFYSCGLPLHTSRMLRNEEPKPASDDADRQPKERARQHIKARRFQVRAQRQRPQRHYWERL